MSENLRPEDVALLDEREWYARAYRGDVPQLTVRSVLMGSVLGFFLSFTNVYVGLKTGWFLGVALSACVLSFAIGRGLARVGVIDGEMNILENVCVQSTASSAGYATGNTVVSAIPAMLMLSASTLNPAGTPLRWYVLLPWIFFVAMLGVVLAIPLKRNMVNFERLPFPSGSAAAITLHGLYSRGQEAASKARALFITACIAGVGPWLFVLRIAKHADARGVVRRDALLPSESNVFDILPTPADDGSWLGRVFHARVADAPTVPQTWTPSDYNATLDHGLALVFAGMLIGLRVAAWMLVGGLVLILFITPPALEAHWMNTAGQLAGAATRPGTAWREVGIWAGASLLVSNGLASFALGWRMLIRAFSGVFRSAPANAESADVNDANRVANVEVPMRWFFSGATIATVGLVTIAYLAFEVPLHLGALAVAMSFAFALVAARATGETDITPGSALGKIVQLTYGVLIPQSYKANLMTAGITAGSSLACADLLTDLKSGYLLGANPRKQFLAQAFGMLTGAVATTLAYSLLVPDARTLLGDGEHAAAFAAPAAHQWRAVAEVFKHGLANLHPMCRTAMIAGIAFGTTLAVVEALTPARHRKLLPSASALGLGMLLPFSAVISMFIGAVVAKIAERANKKWTETYLGVIAAGGLVGESIMGVLVQVLNNFVLTGR